jgi:hypothetical protein
MSSSFGPATWPDPSDSLRSPLDRAWEPLSLKELVAVMGSVNVPWWFAGGHALELGTGRSWRAHDDIDVGISRLDVGALQRLIPAWELHVAARGSLKEWDGTALSSDRHENNVWVRRPGGTWAFDIVIGDGDREVWRYRRDPAFSLPWDRAVLRSDDGFPYLAPALQLLFKSVNARPKDDVDASVVIPTLDAWSLALLDLRLLRGHPWLVTIAEYRSGMPSSRVIQVLGLLHAAKVTAWVDGRMGHRRVTGWANTSAR